MFTRAGMKKKRRLMKVETHCKKKYLKKFVCETTVAQQSDLELRFEGGKC